MEGNLCRLLHPSDMQRLVDLHRGVPSHVYVALMRRRASVTDCVAARCVCAPGDTAGEIKRIKTKQKQHALNEKAAGLLVI